MPSIHSNRTDFVRYGIGLIGVMLVGFVLSDVMGIKLIIRLWALVAAIAVGATLLFLTLFYRLVKATERIADQL